MSCIYNNSVIISTREIYSTKSEVVATEEALTDPTSALCICLKVQNMDTCDTKKNNQLCQGDDVHDFLFVEPKAMRKNVGKY